MDVIIRAIKVDAFVRISTFKKKKFVWFWNNDAVSEHFSRLVRDEKATSVGFFSSFSSALIPRREALEDAA